MRSENPNIIDEAVNMLRAAAPGAKIIIFGSRVRGGATAGSDLDILVVESEVKSKWDETVRLRDALRPLRVPVDILVVSDATFQKWADTPGTVCYEAVTEGRVFDAVA